MNVRLTQTVTPYCKNLMHVTILSNCHMLGFTVKINLQQLALVSSA